MVPSFISTWRALLVPRRAVPLALVLVALLCADWIALRKMEALVVGALLFASFLALGPALWRLFSGGRDGLLEPGQGDAPNPSRLYRAVGLVAYVSIGFLTVALLGVVLPLALGGEWLAATDPSSLVLIFVLFLVGGWGLGRDIELEEGLRHERVRAEALARARESAELLAIRAHLDPHFLFNTLNAIAEWCRDEPRVAEVATLKLAAMLRDVLDGIHADAWPLSIELDLARRYTELYEVRDSDRFRFTWDVPVGAAATLPPMLLLPLVENAVRHGPAAGHRGTVSVRVRECATALIVEVKNPGLFGGPRPGGHGLSLVQRRMLTCYGDSGRLSHDTSDGQTTARLCVPLHPDGPRVHP